MGKTRNGKITERQLRMIEMRAEGHTLAEVGAVFGITGSGARENINVAERMIRKHGLEAVLPDGVQTHHTQEELLSGLPAKRNLGPRMRFTAPPDEPVPIKTLPDLEPTGASTFDRVTTVGELKKALAELPDTALLNIGTRKEGYELNAIGYDGISVSLVTYEIESFVKESFTPESIEEMAQEEAIANYRDKVSAQIHILTDAGRLSSDQEIYCLTHLDTITAQYVKQADAWEAKHGHGLPLSIDLEIIQNAISQMAQKTLSQAPADAPLHETALYKEALAYFNRKNGRNIGNEFVRNHAAELIACYENKKDLLDFDFWTRYEALMGEKLTLDEYQTIDSLFASDPIEVAPSDTTIIAGWKADLEDYRNKPQSFTERLTSAIERAAGNAQQLTTPEKEPSI